MWMQARGSGGSAIPTFHMVAKIKGCKLQQFHFLPQHQSKRTDSWKRQRSVNILNKQQKCTILKLSQSDKMLKAAFPFENQLTCFYGQCTALLNFGLGRNDHSQKLSTKIDLMGNIILKIFLSK